MKGVVHAFSSKMRAACNAFKHWFSDRTLDPYDTTSVTKQRAVWVQRMALVCLLGVLTFFFVVTYKGHRITSIEVIPKQNFVLPSLTFCTDAYAGGVAGITVMLGSVMTGSFSCCQFANITDNTCRPDPYKNASATDPTCYGLEYAYQGNLNGYEPGSALYNQINDGECVQIRPSKAWVAPKVMYITLYTKQIWDGKIVDVYLDAENCNEMCSTFHPLANTALFFRMSKSILYYSNGVKVTQYPLQFMPSGPDPFNDYIGGELSAALKTSISILFLEIELDTFQTITKLETNHELVLRIIAATLGAFGGIVTLTTMLLRLYNFVAFKKEDGISQNIREPVLHLLQRHHSQTVGSSHV